MHELLAHWPIFLLFFGVAVLYSSVGFGGGSSYLAILTLFGFSFEVLRPLALLCNITVVSNGTIQYGRKAYLQWHKLWPLALTSIPAAYIGGRIRLAEESFFILLGVLLILAAILMWLKKELQNETLSKLLLVQPIVSHLAIGLLIGFVSGLVGIGGGIFLAPILYLIKWDSPKKIAAASSFFILVNSIAGLLGQWALPSFNLNWHLAAGLIGAVAIGGFLGNFLGRDVLPPKTVRRATALLVFYVGVTILIKYLF